MKKQYKLVGRFLDDEDLKANLLTPKTYLYDTRDIVCVSADSEEEADTAIEKKLEADGAVEYTTIKDKWGDDTEIIVVSDPKTKEKLYGIINYSIQEVEQDPYYVEFAADVEPLLADIWDDSAGLDFDEVLDKLVYQSEVRFAEDEDEEERLQVDGKICKSMSDLLTVL